MRSCPRGRRVQTRTRGYGGNGQPDVRTKLAPQTYPPRNDEETDVKVNSTPLKVSAALLLIALGPSAAQDARPEAGAIVFKKCMACHQVGPHARNGIGPVLNGVIGRPAGQYPGYSY